MKKIVSFTLMTLTDWKKKKKKKKKKKGEAFGAVLNL